jgi:hypothetical protein
MTQSRTSAPVTGFSQFMRTAALGVAIVALLGNKSCALKGPLVEFGGLGILFGLIEQGYTDPPTLDAPSTPTVPWYAFLHRESDCSLTRVATDAQFNIISSYPNYQDYIHQLLPLATTADAFPKGCADTTIGLGSQAGAILATTSAGRVVANITNNGFETFVVSPTGIVVSGPTQFSTIGTPGPGNVPAAAGLTAADLNGDGIPDLVVATLGFNPPNVGTLSIYLSNADGTLKTPTVINTTIPVTSVTIDDVNSDGKLDLIATALQNPGDTTTGLNVFLGNGTGGFGAAIPGSAGVSAIMAVTGDFNKDGKKDLVTNTGQILLGNNDGTFTLQPNVIINTSFSNSGGPGVVAVAAGDFNHDGNLDLAFSNQNAVTIDIYLGHGNGTFTYAQSYAATFGSTSLSVVDLDGDGNPDIFLGTFTGGEFSADPGADGLFQSFLGRGDGTFIGAKAYLPIGPGASGINFFDMADFNGDQKPDMATIDIDNNNGPYLNVQLGNGDGTFATQPPIPLTADFNTTSFVNAFLAADVDGDGKSDIVFAHTNNSQASLISVLIGNGNGTFATQVDYTAPGPVVSVVAIDLNGDKKPDLALIVNPNNSFPPTATLLYTMLNKGDGTFAAAVQADAKPFLAFLAAGDVNGDGVPDLVASAPGDVSNSVAGATYLYIGNGNGTLKAAQTVNGGANPSAVAIADMNGDSKADLVVSGSSSITTGYVQVLLNNGSGGFTQAKVAATDDAFPASVAVGDLDQDGHPDVVLSGCCGQAFSFILHGVGDGSFDQNASGDLQLSNSTTQVKLIDVNNDKALDFVALANGLALEVMLHYSAAVPVTAPTNTALAASASTITVGQPVTFTATVTPQSGTAIPTGSVTFFDGATAIGTSPLNGSGVATLMTSSLAQGAHRVTGTYGGDMSFTASSSSAVAVQVNAATLVGTSTALTGPSTAATGASVTVSAAITPASGTATPTGTVTFLDGANSLGIATLASGVATFSTSTLAAGMHSIIAMYGGDTNFASSTSTALSISITNPTFALSANPTTITVTRQHAGTSVITVTPSGGFNQAINFSCGNLPDGVDCEFQPSTLTPSGSPATTTLTVSEGTEANGRGRKSAGIAGVLGETSGGNRARSSSPGFRLPFKAPFIPMLGAEMILLATVWRRRKSITLGRWQVSCALVLFATIATFIGGCSGSSGGSTTPTTIQINAAVGNQTVQLPLTVNIQN